MYKLFVLYDNKNVKEHIVSIVRKTELPLNTEYINTADLYKNLTDKPDIAIVSCNKDSNTLSIARQLS